MKLYPKELQAIFWDKDTWCWDTYRLNPSSVLNQVSHWSDLYYMIQISTLINTYTALRILTSPTWLDHHSLSLILIKLISIIQQVYGAHLSTLNLRHKERKHALLVMVTKLTMIREWHIWSKEQSHLYKMHMQTLMRLLFKF